MKRLGIIGGGQLGLMMIVESRCLPVHFNVLVVNRDEPACKVADSVYLVDDYKAFVDNSDIVTFEFEHVDARALEYASSQNKLRPNMKSISLKRQRTLEKQFFTENGLPTGKFIICKDRESLKGAIKSFESGVIKESTGGYDGKGQYYYSGNKVPEITAPGPFVVEEFVRYDYEASIISCRTENGEFFSFKPSYNENFKGMLLSNKGPINLEQARIIARKLLDSIDYIGVLGLEFFVVNGQLLINEFAPRVHNSGNHTLMGNSISQFELHVRAVLGFSISEPISYANTGIVNIIGKILNSGEVERILQIPETRLYIYGKTETRKRRKMGHVCISSDSKDILSRRIDEVKGIIYHGERENPLL